MNETPTDFLSSLMDYAMWGALALGGATVNLLLHRAAGTPITRTMAFATLLSGFLFGVTGSAIIGSYIGIDATKAGGMGFCALLTGMLGIKIATLVVNMDLKLPFGGGQPK